MKTKMLFVVVLILLCSGSFGRTTSGAQTITWPMPCSGKLEFIKVVTKTEKGNWLADKEVQLGVKEAEYYAEDYLRYEAIAGSLSEDGSPDSRYYLIGKTEVSENQYHAIMSNSACNELDWNALQYPITEISWFDAVEFTRKYTEWLGANHPQVLENKSGRQQMFVRLPTEAEWEFAARGGNIVDQEKFRQPVFPLTDSLNEYAWYASQQSCNGKVHPVAAKRPNPLGLHDVLGNVEEMVFEPYRLNTGYRLHGQAGGFTVKGGSCGTELNFLTTYSRSERDYYQGNPRTATRSKLLGFRVLVSAVAISNFNKQLLLNEDFSSLNSFENKEYNFAKFNNIIKSDIPADLKNALSDAFVEFKKEIALRNRKTSRTIQSIIRTGGMAVRQYRSDSRLVNRYKTPCEAAKEDPELDSTKFCRVYQNALTTLSTTRTIYSELLFQVAEDFTDDELLAQKELALESIMSSPKAGEFIDLFICQVSRYRNDRSSDISVYFEEISTLDMSQCNS